MKWKQWGLLFSLLFLILGCRTNSIEKKEPEAVFSSEAIFAEYLSDWTSSRDKYNGKILEISGEVQRVGEDSALRPFITFPGKKSYGEVQIFFEPEQEEKVRSIHPGQQVRVKAVCLGKTTNVTFDRGVFLE